METAISWYSAVLITHFLCSVYCWTSCLAHNIDKRRPNLPTGKYETDESEDPVAAPEDEAAERNLAAVRFRRLVLDRLLSDDQHSRSTLRTRLIRCRWIELLLLLLLHRGIRHHRRLRRIGWWNGSRRFRLFLFVIVRR